MAGIFRRYVGGLVDAAGRRPVVVVLLSILFVIASWTYAKRLDVRSELLELLPRESPGFKAYEHQLGRVGAGATFIIVVESPDAAANRRFVDDFGGALEQQAETRARCVAECKDDACKTACGPDFISYVERGTKDLQAFFDKRQWLYASVSDLVEADDTLDHQIALKSGMVDDLEAPNEPHESRGAVPARPEPKPNTAPPAPSSASATPSPASADVAQPTLGMNKFYDRWKSEAKKHNDFPTGYFTNEAGTVAVIRIVSNASGTGGYTGDLFLADMSKRVADLRYKEKYHPQMNVGFAGDIPNAVAEKESTISEAWWASGLAGVLILGGIAFYYRSGWSLLVIALPAFMGVGAAYAFAAFVFGYVNTVGAFLGAIILGNGINYPIVLLSRYREFRAIGMPKETARREAVLNAFRAELVGASVASIAYGSLTITQFRGFSQFGTIGFVGMLLVWVAIVPVVPAMIVIVEWIQEQLPISFSDAPARSDGSSGPVMRFIARITERFPRFFVVVPIVITAVAVAQIPAYLRDPWEYNFSKLGSRSSKVGGAGEWSNKADEVFRGKQNISGTLILADAPDQVPALEQKILENDRADAQGQLIDEIVTVQHFLPGTVEEQKQKLAVLDRMRDRLTPYVLSQVSEDERKRLEEMKPPEDLGVTLAKDLPPLIRRRFEENNGVLGTLMYIKYKYGVSFSDGRTLLRMAKTTDNVRLADGTMVQTASRSTIFAEMIRSMERDGPLATGASFVAVMIVVILATRSWIGSFSVLLALLMGVATLVGVAAFTETKLNFFNFIALPITFGIGCEYPFNVFDRTRLLKGDVTSAVARTGGAVALCSYTTTIGYGSMLFSDFQALQSFGRLAMWGEVACTVTALLFLPSLLHLLLRTKDKKQPSQGDPTSAASS